MSNFKDFDSFFKEVEKKPLAQIKVFGKMYDLPSSIPATAIFRTYESSKAGDVAVSEAIQMEVAIDLLGANNVKEWCSMGMTMDQLSAIMKWAVREYAGTAEGLEGSKGGGSQKKL